MGTAKHFRRCLHPANALHPWAGVRTVAEEDKTAETKGTTIITRARTITTQVVEAVEAVAQVKAVEEVCWI